MPPESRDSDLLRYLTQIDHSNFCPIAMDIFIAIWKITMDIIISSPTPRRLQTNEVFLNPEMYSLESKIDHKEINTDQLIVRETRSTTKLSPCNQLILTMDPLEQ